ncbi:MAG TPA: hypothetical protein ENG87_03585 [Candidatus Pacearchaeota archaeon]|nr:hypothetical protein [Candidatus Pacearchaeota archaeon]
MNCEICKKSLDDGKTKVITLEDTKYEVHVKCDKKRKLAENIKSGKKETSVKKKVDTKKVKKVKKVKKEKKEKKEKKVKKNDKPVTDEKKKVRNTIGSLVRKMIKEEKKYEIIETAVRKYFPESKFNKAHYYWYRANLD